MRRRWPALVLLALVVLLQWPLWFGKGGWLRVWDVDRRLAAQREVNLRLEIRNAGLEAEVKDLKSGYEAVEERARFELGLIKPDEMFVQVPRNQRPRARRFPPSHRPTFRIDPCSLDALSRHRGPRSLTVLWCAA